MDIVANLLQAYPGFFLFLLCLFFLGLFAQWIAWTFSLGRFSRVTSTPSKQNLRYVFSEAAVKIINDFRHLLALVVVSIFGFALCYAMNVAPNMKEMKEALQAIVATLGGLVGSIIGYYFGESAVAKAQDTKGTESLEREVPPPAIQGASEQITRVPPPPSQGGKEQQDDKGLH